MEATRKVYIVLLGITAVLICDESLTSAEGQEGSANCKQKLETFLEAWNESPKMKPLLLEDILVGQTEAQERTNDASNAKFTNGNLTLLRTLKVTEGEDPTCEIQNQGSKISVNASISGHFQVNYFCHKCSEKSTEAVEVRGQFLKFYARITGTISTTKTELERVEDVQFGEYDVIAPVGIPNEEWKSIYPEAKNRTNEAATKALEGSVPVTKDIKTKKPQEECSFPTTNNERQTDCENGKYMVSTLKEFCGEDDYATDNFCDTAGALMRSMCPAKSEAS